MKRSETKTNEENSNNTINSIVVWLKGMAIAFILALVALLVVGFITARNFSDQRARDNLQDEQQLAARIKEGCLNYNRDKTVDRIAAHEKIFALAKLAGRDVDLTLITEEQKVRIAEYDARMAQLYSYRKCDEKCAISYTNKDIEDCPPSDNEEGT